MDPIIASVFGHSQVHGLGGGLLAQSHTFGPATSGLFQTGVGWQPFSMSSGNGGLGLTFSTGGHSYTLVRDLVSRVLFGQSFRVTSHSGWSNGNSFVGINATNGIVIGGVHPGLGSGMLAGLASARWL